MTLLDDGRGGRLSRTDQGEAPELPTADALHELHRSTSSGALRDGPPAPGRAAAVRHGRYRKIVRRGRGRPVRTQTRRSRSCCGHWVPGGRAGIRVFYEGKLGPLQGHMVLAGVTATRRNRAGRRRLRQGFLHPVRLDSRAEQADPHGVYRFVDGEYATSTWSGTASRSIGWTPGPAPTTTSGRWATTTTQRRIAADRLPVRHARTRRRRSRSWRPSSPSINGRRPTRHLTSRQKLIDEWRTWFGIELTWFPPLRLL